MSPALPSGYVIIHLPSQSPDWASVLTQFTMAVAAREGRMYAAWATERLSRAIETGEGLVAIADDGTLLGMMLFEIIAQAAEISLPWTRKADHRLQYELTEAVLQVLREEHPALRYLRVERQLLPGETVTSGPESAGFRCHWRERMALELTGWQETIRLPEGFRLQPWNVQWLDAVAGVVFRANAGTLDARLYAPFFGESPAQCRKGLLAILAGKYGPVSQQATLCAFRDEELVGVNLVVDEENRQASIVEISVDPPCQHHGLGRALMVASLTVLQEQHFERAELAVTRENTGALHLYESLGFIEIGSFPVCYWPQS